MEGFLNGARVANNTTNVPAALLAAATNTMGFVATGAQGTVYRVYEEDMYVTKQSAPSVTAAQLVAADYALFSGKFA